MANLRLIARKQHSQTCRNEVPEFSPERQSLALPLALLIPRNWRELLRWYIRSYTRDKLIEERGLVVPPEFERSRKSISYQNISKFKGPHAGSLAASQHASKADAVVHVLCCTTNLASCAEKTEIAVSETHVAVSQTWLL